MKEYFSHDYNTRDDEKIQRLLYAHEWLGYGLYWAIIESLYLNEGYLLPEYERIAFDMRTDAGIIESIICDFGLFKFKKKMFYSESVLRRIDERTKRSESARYSASVRWDNVNAKRTQSDSNAIKVKEKKEKKSIEERQEEFKSEVESFADKYSIEMLRAFYVWWSEANQAKTKMKKELQDTWETNRRLITWFNRSKK